MRLADFSRSGGTLGYPFVANVNRWLVRLVRAMLRLYEENAPRSMVVLFQPVDWLLTQYLSSLCRCAGYLSFSVKSAAWTFKGCLFGSFGGATVSCHTDSSACLQLGKL